MVTTENVYFSVFVFQEKGKKITESMRKLEKDKMTEMEEIISHGVKETGPLVNLFSGSVEEEMALYSKK